jgi:hypothetical protein
VYFAGDRNGLASRARSRFFPFDKLRVGMTSRKPRATTKATAKKKKQIPAG